MRIILSLGSRSWEFSAAPEKHLEYKIFLELCEIDRILGHEKTLPDSDMIFNLADSVWTEGFLHPILVTETSNQYVIADGTHRVMVLNRLKSKMRISSLNIPLVNLSKSGYRRESWALVYGEKITSLRKVLLRYDIIKTNKLTYDEIIGLFGQGDVAVIFRIDQEFGMIKSSPFPRHDFLKVIKSIDQEIGEPLRYDTIEHSLSTGENFVIFAPPQDSLGDMKVLVRHPSLQRCKGSRTMVPVRPMYLPIPFSVLCRPKTDVENEIQRLITDLITQKQIVLVSPGTRSLDFCGDVFDHFLLVFHRELFEKKIDALSRRNETPILLPVSAVKL
ncbi:MAG: hypothetical protein ACTSYO_05115 [Candidatus Ranarchaeia archaeon]